jgi:hypothetical protein
MIFSRKNDQTPYTTVHHRPTQDPVVHASTRRVQSRVTGEKSGLGDLAEQKMESISTLSREVERPRTGRWARGHAMPADEDNTFRVVRRGQSLSTLYISVFLEKYRVCYTASKFYLFIFLSLRKSPFVLTTYPIFQPWALYTVAEKLTKKRKARVPRKNLNVHAKVASAWTMDR